MKDHTHQTIQDIRAGILGINTEKPAPIVEKVEPDKPAEKVQEVESLQDFLARMKTPQVRHDGWIETNPAVFKHFVGEQKTDYFWYDNVKVFITGQRDFLEEKDQKTVSQKVFGDK